MNPELNTTQAATNDTQFKIESKFIQLTDELAGQFRNKREQRGWSQTVLAEKSTVGRKFIIDIEGGKRNPELKSILALAMALGYGIRIEFTRL